MATVIVRFIGDARQLTTTMSQVAARTSRMDAGFNGVSATLGRVGRATSALGRTVTMNSLPLIAMAGYATKMAIDYEDSINKTRRLAQASAEDAKGWSKEILDLSKVVGIGPKELADGLYFVASAGVEVSNVMGVLEASAKGAAIGLGETKNVADILTSVVNAYGIKNISAAEAVEVLTRAVKYGKGEPEQYARALGRVVAPAAEVGVSFDQLGGAMAGLTNQGLSVAESATALRQMMVTFLKPSKQTQKALESIGWSAEGVRKSIKDKGLLQTMIDLREATKGNQEVMANIMPNVRALNGMYILTGENVKANVAIMGKMKGGISELDKSFKEVSETTRFKFNKSLATLQSVGVEVATALMPVLGGLADKLSAVGRWFSDLSPTVQKFVGGLVLAGAIAGPLLMILGAMASGLSILLSPIGLVVASIVGLAAAGVWAYNNLEGFRKVVDRVWEAVSNFVKGDLTSGLKGFWDAITGSGKMADLGGFAGLLQDIGGALRSVGEAAVSFTTGTVVPGVKGFFEAFSNPEATNNARGFEGVMRTLGATARDVFNWLSGAFEDAKAWFSEHSALWSSMWTKIQQAATVVMGAVKPAWDAIVAVVSFAVQLIGGIVYGIVKFVQDLWTRFGEHLVNGAVAAWNGLVDAFSGIWEMITGIFNMIAGLFTGDWSRLWEGVKQVFTGAWNFIVGIFKFIWNTITTLLGAGLAAISSLWGYVWGGIKNVTSSVWGGIRDAITGAWNWASGIVSGGVTWLRDHITGVWNGIVSFFTTLPTKIGNAVSGMWDGIKDAFRGALNWIIDKWNSFGFTFPTIDVPVIGKVGGWHFDTPNIPRFGRGGIVDEPTLAIIGERRNAEVVFPTEYPNIGWDLLRRAGVEMPGQAAGQSGSGAQINITQYITAYDPRTAAVAAGEEAFWAAKTSGA